MWDLFYVINCSLFTMIEDKKKFNINRIAVLYKDLLSDHFHKIPDKDKELLLKLKPNRNKIIAIGDVDPSNWNAYVLTYLLENKYVAPTVLDESKIYQSIQAMRTHNESIMHPQMLISQSVVIRIVGYDNSANINDYVNTFISMCIASDECKIIFVVIDGDKRFYKNNIFIRKYNSSFIDITSADKTPYKIESSKLVIEPDEITFFNYSRKDKDSHSINKTAVSVTSTVSNRKSRSLASLISESDFM